ncbi:MAG: MarR family transcriptional regulator [bacterium]
MATTAYTIGFYLSRASRSMRYYVDRLFEDSEFPEVSMGYIGVLLELHREDDRTISDLSRAVRLEKSTMTGLIERMVRAGLIVREQDENDRRAHRIRLTERGREVRPLLDRVLSRSYSDLTRGLSNKDIEKTKQVLSRIIENAAAK